MGVQEILRCAPPWRGPEREEIERRRQGLGGLEQLDAWLEQALESGLTEPTPLHRLPRKIRQLLTPFSAEEALSLRERTRRHLNRYRATLRLADSGQALELWNRLREQVPELRPAGSGPPYSALGRLEFHYKLHPPRPDLPPELDRDRVHLSLELFAGQRRDAYTLTWRWPDDRPLPESLEVENEWPVGDPLTQQAVRAAREAGFPEVADRARWVLRWQADEERFLPRVSWVVSLDGRSPDGGSFPIRYCPDSGETSSSRTCERPSGSS